MIRLLVAACVPLAGAVAAAPPPPPSPAPAPTHADPLDARVPVPAVAAPVALARYRRAGVPEPAGWREANEAVSRIGGWKAYLREAQSPEAPASGPAARPEHRHAPR